MDRECDCPSYVTECGHVGDWRVWFIDWGEDEVFSLHGPARLHRTESVHEEWDASPDVCGCQVIADPDEARAEFERRRVRMLER